MNKGGIKNCFSLISNILYEFTFLAKLRTFSPIFDLRSEHEKSSYFDVFSTFGIPRLSDSPQAVRYDNIDPKSLQIASLLDFRDSQEFSGLVREAAKKKKFIS